MVSQDRSEGKHRVAVLFSLRRSADRDLIPLVERRMQEWFGNAEFHMGALIDEGDLVNPGEIRPTAIVFSEVRMLSDLALARVVGLGLMLNISYGKDEVAVAVDDDLILL